MELISWLITLISGAAGGNIAGAAMPDKSLGTLWNSVVGLLGGTAGYHLLEILGVISKAASKIPADGTGGPNAMPNLDLTSILENIGTSGVSGAIVLAIVALIKNHLNK